MRPRRARSWAIRLRHASQLLFLLAFFGLVIGLRPLPAGGLSRAAQFFFEIDPLLHLVTLLAAHALLPGLIFAGMLGLLTILLGRVFCGWVCPLGTLHGITGRLFDRFQKRRMPQHTSRWQNAKYVVLAAVLVMAAAGSSWLVLLDPLVIVHRSTITALLPFTQGVLEDGSTAIYDADPGVGDWRVTAVTEPAYGWIRDRYFVKPEQAFIGAGLVLGFFLLLLALNAVRRRFWCRYLCPLGALLGIFAWRPWLRRQTDEAACNQCDLCGHRCAGAAGGGPGTGWKPQECFGCLNCTDSCQRGALRFELVAPWRSRKRDETVDLSRRELLGGVTAGIAGLALLRVNPTARGATFSPELIRPPGSRDEREFLSRCTACGLCMKVCPTGGLQPCWSEAGLAGLWTPKLVPRIGYCDHGCNRCGQICPTQAIVPLTLEEKRQTRIGLAAFDVTRCLPYAFGRNCIVCEEHCPIPDKAIYFREVQGTDRKGNPVTLRQPHVDPDKCTGCGICEHVCPFRDRPAVRVTSANETRHAANQPILPVGDSPYPGL